LIGKAFLMIAGAFVMNKKRHTDEQIGFSL